MDLRQTPHPPPTGSLVRHLLFHLPVELVLGDLPQPAEHHRDEEGVVVLEILVIIWTLCVDASEEVPLLVLILRVSQAT